MEQLFFRRYITQQSQQIVANEIWHRKFILIHISGLWCKDCIKLWFEHDKNLDKKNNDMISRCTPFKELIS